MNFIAVCRTCLSTKNLNPIFVKSWDHIRYSNAIFVTTGIKVDINDGLPQQMCTRCISFSNASLKFRKQCKDAETRLLQAKNECYGAAETLNSGAVDIDDFNDKDMRLELKIEEDSEIDDGDIPIKSEADNEVEDNGSDALYTMVNPSKLEPAGGAWAAPECSHTRPGKQPRLNISHKELVKLTSCFVRIERFAIEDFNYYLPTCKTCLMTFDCKSGLRNHICKYSVKESKSIVDKVCDETDEIYFKFDICGEEFVQKRDIISHLAAHNVKQGNEKLLHYSSDEGEIADTEEISYSDSDSYSKTQFRNQSVSSIHTDVRPGPYICDVCSKESSRKFNLIKHIRKLHKDDIDKDKNICNICKKRCICLSQLTAPTRVHTGETPFTCDVCKKQFNKKSDLNRHTKVHTGEKPFNCDVCKKQFDTRSIFTRHIKIHTGEKPFQCDICKKRFTLGTYLTTHRRIHTGEKPYACRWCSKKFIQKTNLNFHMKAHTGEDLFSCDICEKKFPRKDSLSIHRRIHAAEKPYSCDFCKKQFTQKGTLTKHTRIHTGEKPFSCSTVSHAVSFPTF